VSDRSELHGEPVETLHDGHWLRLRRRGRWEYVERSHSDSGLVVIIAATTPDDHVLFVEQFRPPLDARTIEMPAGLVGDTDSADTIEQAAGRELIEETGWQAKRVDVLLTGPASAGISSERIAFARATDLQRVGTGGGVGHEQIEVHEVPVADAPAWLMRKGAEGYELDLKLWAGLWLLDRNPDGSPSQRPSR
jgi:ADP-ribose pyrophosphatase